jgi:hypothetical protein
VSSSPGTWAPRPASFEVVRARGCSSVRRTPSPILGARFGRGPCPVDERLASVRLGEARARSRTYAAARGA